MACRASTTRRSWWRSRPGSRRCSPSRLAPPSAVGVAISVTTIPASALFGVSLGLGEVSVSWGAAAVLGVNVVLLLLSGVAHSWRCSAAGGIPPPGAGAQRLAAQETTCTTTVRSRGRSSKSIRTSCCQVPSARRPPISGTCSEAPISEARWWACELVSWLRRLCS